MRIGLENVAKTIANYYGLTLGEFRDRNRCRKIALPRQICMFLAREIDGIDGKTLSYPKIGRYLCRDHTTIMAGERRIMALLATDPKIASDVSIIRGILFNASDEFKPFKSAAQSAMVFVSGMALSQVLPIPDNLARRDTTVSPGRSFFPIRRPNSDFGAVNGSSQGGLSSPQPRPESLSANQFSEVRK